MARSSMLLSHLPARQSQSPAASPLSTSKALPDIALQKHAEARKATSPLQTSPQLCPNTPPYFLPRKIDTLPRLIPSAPSAARASGPIDPSTPAPAHAPGTSHSTDTPP